MQATFLYVTPMHMRMLTSESSGRALPPSLKRVMSVSSRLHPQAARDFQARYHVPVSQGYGIIEVGLPIMNIAEAAEHPEAIGRPVAGFEATIVDETMKPMPEGETGQLALRGPGMFSGYLNPPRSREEVLHDGWFLTGDLAHRDSGGRIVLDGRTSSVIHIAGHKVFPGGNCRRAGPASGGAALAGVLPARIRKWARRFTPKCNCATAVRRPRAKTLLRSAAASFRATKCRPRSNSSPKSA